MIDSPDFTLIGMVQPPLQERQDRSIQRLAERLHELDESQILNVTPSLSTFGGAHMQDPKDGGDAQR